MREYMKTAKLGLSLKLSARLQCINYHYEPKRKEQRVAEASFWCCSIKYPGDNYYPFTQWDDLHQKQNIQKLIHIF